MLRAAVAVLAALLLIGVLSMLIVESRAVKEDYYVAHAGRVRAIETSRNDLNTIVQDTRSAFEDARALSSSTDLAFLRLRDNNELLQDAEPRLRENSTVDAQLQIYNAELSSFIRSGEAFAARQNAFAEALRIMQEESPIAVKELRRYNLRLQSQNTFSLAIDVIEYATGAGGQSSEQLTARIESLRNDTRINSQVPGIVDPFVNAASAVLQQKTVAANALQTVGKNRIGETLWSLSDEILDDNRQTVSRAEMARLLLSVCTVLLMLGAGFAMFRLQGSYRELNKSNRDLESVNNSLEERVEDRTQKLSLAYDDLKESQVQLVQAEKMSSLGELVAGISHEINTPLWYLISNSTVLQERMEAVSEFIGISETMIKGVQTGAGAKEAVNHGLVELNRMLQDGMKDDIDEASDLINDSIEGLEELTELAQSLKDFSRLDRARHGEFNVNDGLDKTLLIAKNRLKNKATVHKYYGDVPSVHCSPSQINQIFLNLLTNAADAIEESGDIVIRTTEDGNKVRISIADTGSGIAPDILSKIRDPFFTTKEVGKGTGLGLSIVEQIIQSHGGELLIESEPGRGTTVTIVLPVVAIKPVEDTEDGDNSSESENDAANDALAEEPALQQEFGGDENRDADVSDVASV
jgi:signal transduction histidine kinase